MKILIALFKSAMIVVVTGIIVVLLLASLVYYVQKIEKSENTEKPAEQRTPEIVKPEPIITEKCVVTFCGFDFTLPNGYIFDSESNKISYGVRQVTKFYKNVNNKNEIAFQKNVIIDYAAKMRFFAKYQNEISFMNLMVQERQSAGYAVDAYEEVFLENKLCEKTFYTFNYIVVKNVRLHEFIHYDVDDVAAYNLQVTEYELDETIILLFSEWLAKRD
jgi:Na+-transporting methylmalonyl-CoA/oxaloacetate decarboxylase gamma subunit